MFAHYDDSGNILFIFEGDVKDNSLNGEQYLPCNKDVDDSTHYVADTQTDPVIREKMEIECDPEVSGLTLLLPNIPEGVEVRVLDVYVVSDAEVILDFQIPGTYRVSLRGGVSYKNTSLEVTIG
ncbi:MAG: hypothetical protein L0L17_05980 [Yaniella sp.]|nr:hypothetical protein [Yaniella sp.]